MDQCDRNIKALQEQLDQQHTLRAKQQGLMQAHGTRARLNQRQLHELAKRRSGVLWQLRPPREVAPVWLRHLSLRDVVRCSAVCREWRSCVLETQELWKTLDLTVEAQTEWEQRLARKHEIQKWKNVPKDPGSIYARVFLKNCPRELPWASIPMHTDPYAEGSYRVCDSARRGSGAARCACGRALGEPSAERLPRYRPSRLLRSSGSKYLCHGGVRPTDSGEQSKAPEPPSALRDARRLEADAASRLRARQRDAVRVPRAAGYGRFDSRRSHAISCGASRASMPRLNRSTPRISLALADAIYRSSRWLAGGVASKRASGASATGVRIPIGGSDAASRSSPSVRIAPSGCALIAMIGRGASTAARARVRPACPRYLRRAASPAVRTSAAASKTR